MVFSERHIRILLWVALGVLGLNLWAFVLVGADAPADPYLPEGAPVPEGLEPPGDPARVRLDGFDEVAIAVTPAGGGDPLAFCLLAALSAAQRARGLMEVTDLQGYAGMAFLYEQDVDHAFYMRNTPTPLSVAWVDARGEVLGSTDMVPCEDREDCPRYSPPGRYRTAIEVPQGGLPALGISDGATVAVGGVCAPVP